MVELSLCRLPGDNRHQKVLDRAKADPVPLSNPLQGPSTLFTELSHCDRPCLIKKACTPQGRTRNEVKKLSTTLEQYEIRWQLSQDIARVGVGSRADIDALENCFHNLDLRCRSATTAGKVTPSSAISRPSPPSALP
ncbi:hypothetical protein [Rhizobium etli]|uniref:hypothetical protein n=1 Tax=Rhizobium etli TaxID=29449 RepID=UPI001F2559FE|nr:hypothetical protein [Rhizobium etli]